MVREPRIIALLGPTCVGKTAVSIALAKELGAEILSVDSRQIYREISIGTAKPSHDDLAAIPHHFIDERSIDDPVTAAQFADEAKVRIEEIHSRGLRVLLVGGSTLYLHALLFGLDRVPASDPSVRKRLQHRLDAEGLPALVADLSRRDPVTYEEIDRSNPRRILRALEVLETTGRPISSFRTGLRNPRLKAAVFVMNRERDDLYGRIDARVDAMLRHGLTDEIKVLLDAGADKDSQALQTIGYKEVIEHLFGHLGREEMIAAIKRNTRRYAKRQLTWLRRYDDFVWVDVDRKESPESVCSRIVGFILRSS